MFNHVDTLTHTHTIQFALAGAPALPDLRALQAHAHRQRQAPAQPRLGACLLPHVSRNHPRKQSGHDRIRQRGSDPSGEDDALGRCCKAVPSAEGGGGGDLEKSCSFEAPAELVAANGWQQWQQRQPLAACVSGIQECGVKFGWSACAAVQILQQCRVAGMGAGMGVGGASTGCSAALRASQAARREEGHAGRTTALLPLVVQVPGVTGLVSGALSFAALHAACTSQGGVRKSAAGMLAKVCCVLLHVPDVVVSVLGAEGCG